MGNLLVAFDLGSSILKRRNVDNFYFMKIPTSQIFASKWHLLEAIP